MGKGNKSSGKKGSKGKSNKKKEEKPQSIRKLRVEKTEEKIKNSKSNAKNNKKKTGGRKKKPEIYEAKAVKSSQGGKKADKKTPDKKKTDKKSGEKKASDKPLVDTKRSNKKATEKKASQAVEMTSIYAIDKECEVPEYESMSLLGIDQDEIDASCIYETESGVPKKLEEKEEPKAEPVKKPRAKPNLKALAKKVKALRDMVMDEELQRKRSDDDWGRFKLLSESLVDLVWTTDLDLNFTYLSPSVKKVLGYNPREALKMTPEDLLSPESVDEFGAWYVDALEGETENPKGRSKAWTLELENLHKDGGRLWTECTVTFIRDSQGRPTGILGVTRDTAKRREEQCIVNDALAMYKSLFESSRDGIIHTGLDGNIIDANRAYLDMLGYSLEDIQKLSYSELTPVKWREAEKNIITTQIAKRGYSEEYEKEYIRKDGTVIPIAIRVWLIIGSNGKPVGFWAISRDITTRKEIEEQTIIAERRLALITENTSDLITVCNLAGTITYISPSYNKLYYSENDLLGTQYFELLKEDDQEELMNFIEGALLDEQDKIGTYFEYYIKDKVGKWHLLESTMNLTKTEGGMRGTIVIISRLSSKKRRSTKRGGKKRTANTKKGKK